MAFIGRRLNILIILTIGISLSNCKPERELYPEISPISTKSIVKKLESNGIIDGPIVLYDTKDNADVIYLKKNLEQKSIIDKKSYSKSDPISVQVYSSDLLQFDLDIRKTHPIQQWKFEDVDSIMAISDIEGNYKSLVNWLRGNAIVDQDFNWIFGDNHLIVNGDMMDRGTEVFQTLWLIYKLEAEAEAAGGKVHFVLGNHEQLNIQGQFDSKNLKYIHSKYQNEASALKIKYADWIGTQSELGRWLRSKNAIVLINDVLFTHGGISMTLLESELTIEEINKINSTTLDLPSREYDEIQSLIALEKGPLWYRGMADQLLSQAEVNEILEYFDAKHIVIGHTIVNPVDIIPIYNGSVIPIDLHHSETIKKGIVKGLLINGTSLFEIDNHGQTKLLNDLLM